MHFKFYLYLHDILWGYVQTVLVFFFVACGNNGRILQIQTEKTAQVGDTAMLSCTLENLDTRLVSDFCVGPLFTILYVISYLNIFVFFSCSERWCRLNKIDMLNKHICHWPHWSLHLGIGSENPSALCIKMGKEKTVRAVYWCKNMQVWVLLNLFVIFKIVEANSILTKNRYLFVGHLAQTARCPSFNHRLYDLYWWSVSPGRPHRKHVESDYT